jgi:hypothetical protein
LTGDISTGTFNETDPICFDINEIVSPPDFLHKGGCPVFVASFDARVEKHEEARTV